MEVVPNEISGKGKKKKKKKVKRRRKEEKGENTNCVLGGTRRDVNHFDRKEV